MLQCLRPHSPPQQGPIQVGLETTAGIYPDAIREEIMQTQDSLGHRRPPRCPAAIPRMSLGVISATLGLFGAGRPAHAQSGDAETLFKHGNDLMEKGKIEEACEAFEASNRADPTAGTLIQLGKCLLRGDRLASAWVAYKGALIRAKDPTKHKIAESNLAALEPRLSYLTISVTDKNRIEELAIGRDGAPFDPANWNLALPVDGHDYVIEAHAPGHQAWRTTVHVAVEFDKVVVEIPRLEPLPTPMSATPLSEPAPATPSNTIPHSPAPSNTIPHSPVLSNRILQTPESPRRSTSATRKVAIGLGGVSVVSLATAAALGVVAKWEQSDASRLCPVAGRPCTHSAEANVLVRAGNRWALDANVAWGIAGAAALASGVMWLIGAPSETTGTQISVVPSAASGEPGVLVIRRSSW